MSVQTVSESFPAHTIGKKNFLLPSESTCKLTNVTARTETTPHETITCQALPDDTRVSCDSLNASVTCFLYRVELGKCDIAIYSIDCTRKRLSFELVGKSWLRHVP